MSGKTQRKLPQQEQCFEEPAQAPSGPMTLGPGLDQGRGNAFMQEQLRAQGPMTEPEGPIGTTMDRVGAVQLPTAVQEIADWKPAKPPMSAGDRKRTTALMTQHGRQAVRARSRARGGAGEDHPYWKQKIAGHEQRRDKAIEQLSPGPEVEPPTGTDMAMDAYGAYTDTVSLIEGGQKLASDDGLEQAEGAAQVIQSGTGLAGTAAKYAAPQAFGTAALGAAGTGMTLAAVAHEGGSHQIQEREILQGDSASDWASRGGSAGEVAARSVLGAGLEVAAAPAGLADMSGQAAGDALQTYTGGAQPKSDRAHAPRNPEESAMAKQAGTRPYSREAWSRQPGIWDTLTNFDETGQSGIVSTGPGTLVTDYVHPENGPWVDPREAQRQEAARQARCDELQASGQSYQATSIGVDGRETGVSIAPGAPNPTGGDCRPAE